MALVEGLRGFVPFSQVSTVNSLPSHVASYYNQSLFFATLIRIQHVVLT